MWYSDILPLQHEVKLADGERNSMAVLLLDYCVAVFLHFFLPVSLHPPRSERLLVKQQSSRHASSLLWTEELESGECVGLDFPSTQRP